METVSSSCIPILNIAFPPTSRGIKVQLFGQVAETFDRSFVFITQCGWSSWGHSVPDSVSNLTRNSHRHRLESAELIVTKTLTFLTGTFSSLSSRFQVVFSSISYYRFVSSFQCFIWCASLKVVRTSPLFPAHGATDCRLRRRSVQSFGLHSMQMQPCGTSY